MTRPLYPPDYVDKEALAYRLSCTVGYVDQLLKRGLLPAHTTLGEKHLWRWSDVDAWISNLGS